MNHGAALPMACSADSADVIGGAGQIAQDDGGGAPKADERQGDAADDQHVDGPPRTGFGKLGDVKTVAGRGNWAIAKQYSTRAAAVYIPSADDLATGRRKAETAFNRASWLAKGGNASSGRA